MLGICPIYSKQPFTLKLVTSFVFKFLTFTSFKTSSPSKAITSLLLKTLIFLVFLTLS